MKVTYKDIDGKIFSPSFEPSPGRLDQLIEFYKRAFHAYEIEAYKVENTRGIVVAKEGNF